MSSRANIDRRSHRETGARAQAAGPASALVLEPVSQQWGISSIVLAAKTSVIGSDPACEVHLPFAGIEPRHGIIERRRNGFVFKAQAGGACLNQMPVDQAALDHGDRLAIGPVEFSIRRGSPQPISPPIDGSADGSAGD